MNTQVLAKDVESEPADNQQPVNNDHDSQRQIEPRERVLVPSKARPMQIKRFLSGMLFSACGIVLMLTVAAGTLQSFGAQGRLSLPAVGLCMIVGLMLLGGGFGIMATSAPVFDDNEFDRMIQSRSPVDQSPNLRRDEGIAAETPPTKLLPEDCPVTTNVSPNVPTAEAQRIDKPQGPGEAA